MTDQQAVESGAWRAGGIFDCSENGLLYTILTTSESGGDLAIAYASSPEERDAIISGHAKAALLEKAKKEWREAEQEVRFMAGRNVELLTKLEKADALAEELDEMINQYAGEYGHEVGWRKRLHDSAREALAAYRRTEGGMG